MGSPISGYLAEEVMQDLEARPIQSYKPKFWMRYEDDTIVIPRRDAKDNFKRELISVFSRIEFAMEDEIDGVPPYPRRSATENGRWRGTDELQVDEVLMIHLVDPSGGPAAPADGQGYDWLNEGQQARNSAVSIYPQTLSSPLLCYHSLADFGLENTAADIPVADGVQPKWENSHSAVLTPEIRLLFRRCCGHGILPRICAYLDETPSARHALQSIPRLGPGGGETPPLTNSSGSAFTGGGIVSNTSSALITTCKLTGALITRADQHTFRLMPDCTQVAASALPPRLYCPRWRSKLREPLSPVGHGDNLAHTEWMAISECVRKEEEEEEEEEEEAWAGHADGYLVCAG
nr:unnamed protein product [Spirometra erinaceieuropaei]